MPTPDNDSRGEPRGIYYSYLNSIPLEFQDSRGEDLPQPAVGAASGHVIQPGVLLTKDLNASKFRILLCASCRSSATTGLADVLAWCCDGPKGEPCAERSRGDVCGKSPWRPSFFSRRLSQSSLGLGSKRDSRPPPLLNGPTAEALAPLDETHWVAGSWGVVPWVCSRSPCYHPVASPFSRLFSSPGRCWEIQVGLCDGSRARPPVRWPGPSSLTDRVRLRGRQRAKSQRSRNLTRAPALIY